MDSLNHIVGLAKLYAIQVIVTVCFVLICLFLGFAARKITKNYARKHDVAMSRRIYIGKLINMAIFFFLVIGVGMIWEVSLKGLSIYFASIFTIVGVALFASWSILSNVTASFILFFFFPYRIGGEIKILDGDNSVEGKIMDITLFYMKIETETGTVFYPNSQIMQKAVSG